MGKLMERKLKDYAVLMLKGMGMGAADVVPGVSGGTIAFIVGIYDELINSIKSINLESLKNKKPIRVRIGFSYLTNFEIVRYTLLFFSTFLFQNTAYTFQFLNQLLIFDLISFR